MALAGFNETYYLTAKLAQLRGKFDEWDAKSTDDLKAYMANVGMTPEEHYEKHGWTEDLNPNEYFNAYEYVEAKAQQLFDANKYVSLAEAKAAFEAAWTGNPYDHYLKHGGKEGVNPSNAFDNSAYLDAKVADLTAKGKTQEDGSAWTADALNDYFATKGLTPLTHFLKFGEDEGLTAPEVPADKQVDPDPGPTTPGETFPLTTGIDTVAGTSGNDTINAALDAGAMTFTSLDSIDGGGGTDTMNLVSTGSIATAAGATVQDVEVVNLTSSAAITAADVTGFTGLETLNVASGAAIAGVKAAATTDVVVANGLAGVAVDGGKDVTISNSTAGNINVGATTAAAGDVTATNSFATGTVAVKADGAITADSNDGAITLTNGSTIDASANQAVDLATITANLAAQAAAAAANTAATTDSDAAGKAKAAAAAIVAALGTLKTDIAAATNVSADQTTVVSIGKATSTALLAGAITQEQKAEIDAAFATGLATSPAQARTDAQAVLTPIQTAAGTASAEAAAADAINDADAAAAKAEADAIVAADVVQAGLVDGVVVTATTNTALTEATVSGNYGSTTNAITDGSTLADKLTTVTLEHAGGHTITGKAVATVNLTDMDAGDDVIINNLSVGNTITINANNSLADIDLSTATADTTTLNIVSTGTNDTVLNAADTKDLNLTGTGSIDIDSTSTLNAALVVDASEATGNVTMSIAAGQTYTGGEGVDTITAGTALQTKTVNGGAGTADKLVLTSDTAFGTTGAAKFTNFEVVEVQNGVTADLTKFTGSTFTSAISNGATTEINGLDATVAGAVTVVADTNLTLGVTGATTVGQIDTVKIDVNDGLAALNTITLTAPSLAGVEILDLTATDNVTVTALTSATALTNVNVAGAGVTSITSGALALNVNSVIDASEVTGDVTLDFSGASANGISLKAGDGDNALTGTDIAGKGNSIISGDGDSTLTGGQADDVITAGDGNNTVVTNNGDNTVTLGNGHNDITGGTGIDTITSGNGINVIDADAGNDVITVGTGYNLITGGTGADIITFGAHDAGVIDGLVYSAINQTLTAADTTAMATAATTDLTGVDVISGLQAGDTIDLSALAATFTGTLATTFAGATGNTAAIVKGNYDAATDTFATSATGEDSMLVWDQDAAATAATVTEAIVLIGFDDSASADAGIITLA